MARLVLLSFDSNKQAELTVRQLCDGGVLPGDPLVEWVVARPTIPCTCAQTEPAGGRKSRRKRVEGSGYTKTQHFGWWVHAACTHVSRLVIDRFVPNMTNGAYDLLPEILGVDAEPNDIRHFHDTDQNWRTKR